MCGGFTGAQPADDQVKNIANEIKPKLEAATNKKYGEFEAVSYKTQVVAGTNYVIKVKVGNNEFVHVKVFQPLPCNGTELQLLKHSEGHKLDDNLDL